MQLDGMDRTFMGALATVLMIAISAFVTMRLGVFHVRAVAGIVALALTVGVFYFRSSLWRRPVPSSGSPIRGTLPWLPYILLGILVLAGLLYALFPTYYLLGGRDPGLYLLFSMHIAQTGGLILDLPVLRDLYATYGEGIHLGFPGIYSAYHRGLSDDPAEMIPQFMHVFPAIGALFYQAGGLEALVRANAVIAVFSLWAFFMVMRRITTPYVALLATVALAINAAFIWNARITLTEALAVALLFSGLYLLIRAFDLKSSLWSTAAGAVLGFAILNRLDAALNVLVIAGVAGVVVARPEYLRTVFVPLTVSYLVFSTWGFIDGYLHAYPYLHDLWLMGSLRGLVFLNYGLPVLAFIFVFVVLHSRFIPHAIDVDSLVERLIRIAVALLAAWLFFAYFLWPFFVQGFNARAAQELAWYVTPITYLVFVYGLWKALGATGRHPIILPLAVLAVFVVFLFTWKPTITPDHVWASRRWVPQVIPLLILFSAVGLWSLVRVGSWARTRAIVAAVIYVFYAGGTLAFAAPFLFQSMMADVRTGYERIVETRVAEGISEPILTQNRELASILTYGFGFDTVLVTDRGLKTRSVGNMNGLFWLGGGPFFAGKVLVDGNIEGWYLEKIRGKKPRQLYWRSSSATLGRVDVGGPVRYRTSPTADGYGSVVGVMDREAGEIRASGEAGFLQFGPYIDLQPGYYRVVWEGGLVSGANDGEELGVVDVVHERGRVELARRTIGSADLGAGTVGEIEFRIPEAIQDLEYRYWVHEGVDMRITGIRLDQTGAPIQAE